MESKTDNLFTLIDRVVAETKVEPRDMLHALLGGLARNHLLGADAFPDYAAPAGTPGAIAEIMALQHWNSKPVWHLGHSMPPFESLLEAVWMSMCRERDVNDGHYERVLDDESASLEAQDQAVDFGDLADRQEGLRCLLEETLCMLDEQKYVPSASDEA